MIELVQKLHVKFGLPDGHDDVMSGDKATQDFRTNFIEEELAELREALESGDKVKAFDALLDLSYVVYGTALFMGLSPEQWHAGMMTVHVCNMEKVKVEHAGESKRGFSLDLRKPDGWVGPEEGLRRILTWPKN